MSTDDVVITMNGEVRTVHLPTVLPTSGTYTIKTGKPVNIRPGFQEIIITITLAPKTEEADQ